MNDLDVFLFGVLNAHATSPVWLIDLTGWFSQHFPDIAIASMLLTLLVGSPRLRRGVALCLIGMLVAWCITRLVRWGFPLERPYELGLGTKWVEHNARPRFPSLHAAVAFAFAAGMSRWCSALHWRWIVPLAAWGAAWLMGWSRVYLGVHLPLDILAGWIVGMVSVWLVHTLGRQLARRFTPRGKFAAYWFRRESPSAPHK